MAAIRRLGLLAVLMASAGCSGEADTSAGVGAEDSVPTVSSKQAISEIPAAMQGRWGLSAVDCRPDSAGAQGLLQINANSLNFYESVAELQSIERQPEGIRAQFRFSGEGMSWDREMALRLADGGEKLIRSDLDEDSSRQDFTYSKCNK